MYINVQYWKKSHFDGTETSMNSNGCICFGVNSRVTNTVRADEYINLNDSYESKCPKEDTTDQNTECNICLYNKVPSLEPSSSAGTSRCFFYGDDGSISGPVL